MWTSEITGICECNSWHFQAVSCVRLHYVEGWDSMWTINWKTWKESVVANFKALFQDISEGT
jgi:hypothetical protein